MQWKRLITLCVFALYCSELSAVCIEDLSCRGRGHTLTIGPEFSYVRREREGGTSQTGTLYGVRASYDRIARCRIYWGLEAAWSSGTLTGHGSNKQHLRSHYTETLYEARLGYTFQSKTATCASFTPFLGYGYSEDLNNYVHPSPRHIHFRNTFQYIAVGAFTRFYCRPDFWIGLNATGRFTFDGKVRVSHDRDQDKATLLYEHKILCRVALPITYSTCCWDGRLSLCLNPFFEYRHFGRHAGFPYNFLDTKLKFYGADIFLIFCF